MKIVKWVTGLDHTKSPSKLLYPAFEVKLAGRSRDEVEQAWREAEDVVKECIRRNGFKFSGQYHDGSVLFCSWRHWGSIMAEAWDPDGSKGLDYMDFYMPGPSDDEKEVAPKHELDFV